MAQMEYEVVLTLFQLLAAKESRRETIEWQKTNYQGELSGIWHIPMVAGNFS